jgi:sec-independent protein translocase protein TatB
MFGMGFSEILLIAIIAVLFLGPEKLPDAMIKIARFFKSFKSSINEAKSTLEQEVQIQELKDEAKKYKEQLNKAAVNTRKHLTFDELDEIKSSTEELSNTLKEVKEGAQKTKELLDNPIDLNEKKEDNV